MSFRIGQSGEGTLILADMVDTKMLCVQMAASIIDAIKKMPVTGKSGRGAGLVLSQYVNWADHGYINHVQTMVAFLYAAIPVLSGIRFLFEKKELDLIKDAMVEYQKFKTAIVQESQRVNGAGFGSATQFVQMDWTDRNLMLE